MAARTVSNSCRRRASGRPRVRVRFEFVVAVVDAVLADWLGLEARGAGQVVEAIRSGAGDALAEQSSVELVRCVPGCVVLGHACSVSCYVVGTPRIEAVGV